MDQAAKVQLINFLNNFSALRIVHNYTMSEEEYLFYTKGMNALSLEFDLMALLTEDTVTQFKRFQNERNNDDKPSEDS